MTGTASRAVLIAVLLALLVAVPIASAAVVLSDDRTTIRAGETVTEDAYIFGDAATINGTVQFDVVAATNTFDLGETGRIGGNVNVAANDVRLRGPIERSVRVAAREVVITGRVGGDVVVAAQTVRIESGATIGGDLRVAAQDVIVAGAVDGDVIGNAGQVDLTGATIGGNVDIDVNEFTIDGTTTVAGDVRYESDDTATIGDDATVSGAVERSTPSSFSNGNVSLTGDTVWSLGRLLAMLITGIALVLAIPAATAAAADGARKRPARSAITGLIALILIPIVAFILLVTVIGIPVSIILLVLFGIALYISQVVVGLAIGRWILPRSWRGTGRGFNLLAMVIGVVLISLVRLIPLPFIDGLAALIVAVIGLGAILVAIHSARRTPASPAPVYWSGPSYGPAPQA
ncbi:MAG TPA: polymer-forming cytoskeletal protein [Thermomicrobiales bacterium]|jgi:cytoskeletal protein CcmA (bactofilin family)|nr:polymer-forming cytoskeletal protein [Thermomicrobiales bacterium]